MKTIEERRVARYVLNLTGTRALILDALALSPHPMTLAEIRFAISAVEKPTTSKIGTDLHALRVRGAIIATASDNRTNEYTISRPAKLAIDGGRYDKVMKAVREAVWELYR